MKLVLISDTHNQHDSIKIPDGDMLIHAGDWTCRGSFHETKNFLKWFASQPHKTKIFIAGNHDFYCENYPRPDVDRNTGWDFIKLRSFIAPNCIYLEDNSVELHQIKIHGSPVSPTFNNWAFNRDEDAIQKHWDLIPDDTQILITHTPFYGYCDDIPFDVAYRDPHLGCKKLRETIDARLKNLKLFVCGHIHCASGSKMYGDIKVINAAILGENYKIMSEPVVLEMLF